MPDVVTPAGAFRLSELYVPGPTDHSRVSRVQPLMDRAVCLTCGLILMAHWETFVVRHEDHEHTIRGAYLPPEGDTIHGLAPFHTIDAATCGASGQVNTDEHLATEDSAPKGRPVGISADAIAKGRSRDTPSRSPEARHAEYERAKRRVVRRA